MMKPKSPMQRSKKTSRSQGRVGGSIAKENVCDNGSRYTGECQMKSEPMRICGTCGKVYPKSKMRKANGKGTFICCDCLAEINHRRTERAHDDALKSISKTVERIKSGETSGVTRTDVINELKFTIDGFVGTWKSIIDEHADLVRADESIEAEAHEYLIKRFVEETT